ncbi:MAG: dienelactone hydrolase family protein [Chloroflexi bacterium]|nr:dienelactone hydrolase family protein [Chloroflexota bacterium]
MGILVTFRSNGGTDDGYLATPPSGRGPGLVVIQEWWGLVDHIKDVCDRFAAEGFVALAPDLYHGKATTEPNEAQKLMMSLNMEQAAKDMSGTVDYLRSIPAVTGSDLGVVGFCMGGALTLALALQRSDAIRAAVPFYGLVPEQAGPPKWERLTAAVLGHYAEYDSFASPAKVREMERQVKALGKRVQVYIYPGTEHAFFNDTRPEVYHADAAKLAWERTLRFLREEFGVNTQRG